MLQHTPDPEADNIRYHVSRFREAIDRTRSDDWPTNMKHFPSECCHHACKLLTVYLREVGLGEFQTYSGKHPANTSGQHLWLQKEDLVIDITADQFDEIDCKAIVTRQSPWHASLGGKPSPPPENENWERDYLKILGPVYTQVCAILSEE